MAAPAAKERFGDNEARTSAVAEQKKTNSAASISSLTSSTIKSVSSPFDALSATDDDQPHTVADTIKSAATSLGNLVEDIADRADKASAPKAQSDSGTSSKQNGDSKSVGSFAFVMGAYEANGPQQTANP